MLLCRILPFGNDSGRIVRRPREIRPSPTKMEGWARETESATPGPMGGILTLDNRLCYYWVSDVVGLIRCSLPICRSRWAAPDAHQPAALEG